MFSLSVINWLAVIVGARPTNALGFLWYGPLFGKPWTAALGKRPEDVQGSPMMYVVTVVTSLLTMIALAVTVLAFGSSGIVEGAVLGLILYVGFPGAPTS